ncbi:MAG TPA: TerC/Alx family metal homeostasis membrane protein [Kofleriaceae bacterium]|nr:TerC/Alx family metal homeostasis membrane protein [Kofleriaceae bacterium]
MPNLDRSRRRALIWSLLWIGLALLVNLVIAVRYGAEAGEQFLATYLLEKSLSVDNLFVFLLVFGSLGIPAHLQSRVLTWGIIGAVVSRGLLIFAGAAAVQRWHALLYVFGAVLVIAAVKLLREPAPEADSRLLGWLERHLPWTRALHGQRFVVRQAGRRVATPLLVALLAIEATDVVFAIDSVPAAFAVTSDPLIIYSSNLLAILGLRSLYVVLADAIARLRYLRFGLAGVLAFAGGKLLAARWLPVPPLLSVAVIVALLAAAVLVSLAAGRAKGGAPAADGSG